MTGEAARHVLYSYAEAGMEPVEVMGSATIRAAALLDRGKIGVVAPGAWANIVAVEGDPEKDVHSVDNVRFVMKNGTVYVPLTAP